MDLALTEEEQMFQQLITEFVEQELPSEAVRRWEEEHRFDERVWQRWADLGWLGLPFPVEHGGAEASSILLALLAEGLARRGYDVFLFVRRQVKVSHRHHRNVYHPPG